MNLELLSQANRARQISWLFDFEIRKGMYGLYIYILTDQDQYNIKIDEKPVSLSNLSINRMNINHFPTRSVTLHKPVFL